MGQTDSFIKFSIYNNGYPGQVKIQKYECAIFQGRLMSTSSRCLANALRANGIDYMNWISILLSQPPETLISHILDWAFIGGFYDALFPTSHHGYPMLAYKPRKFDLHEVFLYDGQT